MVNVIMELIDRFIEFILQRLPDDATENEKNRYVMRMMVISFSVLFWGLIAITAANIDLKRDNYALNKTVGKVNTLLDINNPANPLNTLLILNNDTLSKLHKVNQENSDLVRQLLNLKVQLSVCTTGFIKAEETFIHEGSPNPDNDNLPKEPPAAIVNRPMVGIKEDDKPHDEPLPLVEVE